MQLILVRHAQPQRIHGTAAPDMHGTAVAADPDLTEIGVQQAGRVPGVLAPHRVARVVSSPQLRARETARPTAEKLGLDVDICDGLAEYDRDLPVYIPIEDAQREFQQVYERIKAGYIPEQIDADAFRARVLDSVAAITAAADHTDTVVAFAHGGVINVLLQDVLGLERPLTFPIDYCSVTRILYSRSGRRTAATVNENSHVWDLLPRGLRS
ncbi:histidine phosphatase family protein [Nocardia otitidiscaviarum]|uniref:histidine phosphatase family protein n=1 Tax=Nocardia otitidiscaviarum TaxID=1823 RepID=UPI001895881D|nr:histidine phosphatase family protein [Nocardia otitidiscaviarum]MBF6178802.1 histidine phosphatase family protein [Nocardia otitidiscaviarum]